MGRRKIKTAPAPEFEKVERSYEIINASIEDDFCNYSFEIKEGIGRGDTHAVKGKGIVKDSMKDAFAKFNVHMACIDDAFKRAGIEVGDIDREHGHELSFLYTVSGFKIKGSSDNESIILIGTKYISSGGRIKLETPKIPLDNFSSYQWKNELKLAADIAREEVALYKEGNYTEVIEEEDETQTRKQTKLQFEHPEGYVPEEKELGDPIDEEFANAAL